MPYFALALSGGGTIDDDGQPAVWASCPDLPGAYEEAPTAEEARAALATLARRILAEHVMRDDPLDPAITATPSAPSPLPDVLVVNVTDADIAEARATPMLVIEQPEP